jgi:hypothetical protein
MSKKKEDTYRKGKNCGYALLPNLGLSFEDADNIIADLKAENRYLKQKVAYWEAKANEYKALLENMERVG